ncbi:MAG: hypothetical protein CMM18_03335 [Rhodospirillaceae bacterium]|nr:hypothetical protein [Rhodospirillaceae bacterium]
MIRDIKLFNFQENSSYEKVLYRARNLSDKIFLNKENHEYKCLTSDFLDPKYNNIKNLLMKWRDRFETIIVIATGGSNLGSKVITNLNLNSKKNCKFIYLDNLDKKYIAKIINSLDFAMCGFLVISKSGNTLEVVSQYLIFLDIMEKKIGQDKVKSHFLTITTKKDNIISSISKEKNIKVIEHDSYISGRFSILSCVGWVPALIAGVNFEEIIRGSNSVIRALKGKNSYSITGAVTMSQLSKSNIYVNILATYEPRLLFFCEWFRQLWSESLGKNGIGMTASSSLLPLDQHSQLQAWIEGPRDKIINILINKDKTDEILIDSLGIKKADFLNGISIDSINEVFAKVIIKALKDSGRPYRVILLDDLDEFTIGQLFTHFMLETILTSELLDLNPFDQPAIEKIKKDTWEHF